MPPKKKGFYMSKRRQKLTWLVLKYSRDWCFGEEYLFLCTEAGATEGRLLAGRSGWVCFGRASSVIPSVPTMAIDKMLSLTLTFDLINMAQRQAG